MQIQPISIRFKRLAHSQDLDLPAYQSEGAAGLDLICALPPGQDLLLEPGGRALIPTGFALELPRGYEAQVRPRSGLALRHGVTVLNAPGTIDADYRGEIQVLLVNFGDKTWRAARGDRIAQLVVAPVVQVRIEQVEILSSSARGDCGFGSTGENTSQAALKR